MIQEPLLNDNILQSIISNFAYFFTFQDMYIYAFSIVAILFVLWLSMAFVAENKYLSFQPSNLFYFNRHNIYDWSGLGSVTVSFVAFCLFLLNQEASVFNNFDTMTIDYIDSLKQGVKSVFGEWRFTPMGGIDVNLVYAISNNYSVIGFYIILKQVFCLFLLYKFFSFMPVGERLAMIAVINFIPSVFWMNNVIYQEQNILIFVVLSLFALNKYQKSGKTLYLLWFVLSMNMAMYIKETVILFYTGYGIWLVLASVIQEKITIESFFHPLKTIKSMPIEYLMFWSMFIYATCYMLLAPIDDNRYLTVHTRDLVEVLNIYKIELAINALALLIMVLKLIRHRYDELNLFGEGGVLGSTIITYAIVFKLRIIPASDYLLAYYCYVPAIFCTAYIFANISKKWLLAVSAFCLVAWSAVENMQINQAQQGKDRRRIAEFIIDNSRTEPMAIYIYTTQRIDYKWWKTMAWSSTMRYVSPQSLLRFKTDLDIYRFYVREDDKFFETALGQPLAGEYVLTNKRDEPAYIAKANDEIAYQNNSYILYKIGE